MTVKVYDNELSGERRERGKTDMENEDNKFLFYIQCIRKSWIYNSDRLSLVNESRQAARTKVGSWQKTPAGSEQIIFN